MENSELVSFKGILDKLADMLKVQRLEDWAKEEYFSSLRKYSNKRFLAGCKTLQETYEPKRFNDFPVLKTVHAACSGAQVKDAKPYTWDCRCCGVPFPASTQALNCPCNYWEHCWTCDKCFTHCQCMSRVEMTKKVEEMVAEFTARWPSLRRKERFRLSENV